MRSFFLQQWFCCFHFGTDDGEDAATENEKEKETEATIILPLPDLDRNQITPSIVTPPENHFPRNFLVSTSSVRVVPWTPSIPCKEKVEPYKESFHPDVTLSRQAFSRCRKNFLTRRVNYLFALNSKTTRVMSPEKDFRDGILLAELAEILTGVKTPNLNQNPTTLHDEVNNLQLVLKTLTEKWKTRHFQSIAEKIHQGNLDSIFSVISDLMLVSDNIQRQTCGNQGFEVESDLMKPTEEKATEYHSKEEDDRRPRDIPHDKENKFSISESALQTLQDSINWSIPVSPVQEQQSDESVKKPPCNDELALQSDQSPIPRSPPVPTHLSPSPKQPTLRQKFRCFPEIYKGSCRRGREVHWMVNGALPQDKVQ